MKHTDRYNILQQIDEQDRRELLAAINAHGGVFRWFDSEGNQICEESDYPIIVGSWKHAEDTEDYVVTHVEADGNHVKIFGYPKMGLFDDSEDIYYIEHGHLGYITDYIPETESVSDVSESERKDSFTVVSVSRDDLKAIGFNGDNLTDDQMQSLAWKMARGFDGDLYWSSLQYACEACDIPKINDNDQ